MRWARLILAVVVVLVAAPACTDNEPGEEAYRRGDYATAFKEYGPLAEQGDATAQSILGGMYDLGLGVPEDDTEAVRWYRLAAAQGYAPAQFNLGVKYDLGRGVPQDDVQAHMWFYLAAAQGIEQARKERDTLAERMTPAQVAEAQRLAREWKPKKK